ncbi:MAG: 50S ribosomal protein L10 [Acidimicrobiaceae bacterium]|nr:50S ribosomal protein L10 [Acidimicrobiaceae bacterium]|tara:strand:- start:388 stop:1164 length:777 start_codon:yes stop_codon:yes gene_type:complete
MGDPRPEKIAVVAEVQEKFSNAEAVILTEYRGLDVTDMAVLRAAMKQAGGEYKVYKNTLVRVAAKELNLEIEELLVGPTAIAFTGTRPDGSSGDPVSIAKALTNFAKDHEDLIIKGGVLEGALLSTEEITALSKIAPREELLARLAGGIAAPLREFASLLNAIPQNFAYALSALIEAGGAGTGTDETTEAVSDDEATEAVSDDEATEAVSDEEAPSQDAEEDTSESVGSSESGTDDDSDEESVEDNKIDGDANENEES